MSQNNPHSPVYSDTPTYYQLGGWGDQWRTDVLSAVDWLGNTFSLGETVMYCIGAGRGQMMALGTVKQIRAKDITIHRYNHQTREKYTEPGVEVEVQVLTQKTSGQWGNQERVRPAWVNPMNITSLNNITESVNN